jgi:hypothetical protein
MSIAVVFLALLQAGSAASCRDVDGWVDGRLGRAPQADCSATGYRQAHRLGSALSSLEAEHAEIEGRLTGTPENGALRRRQRQIQIDLEAIRGVATVQHWPLESPQEKSR